MSQSRFVHKALIFIPAAYQPTANSLAESVTGNPSDLLTFTVPLNASGLATDAPTYYWAFPALQESAWQNVKAMASQIPGGVYYCLSNATGLLEEVNKVGSAAVVGQPWTPAQALVEMGLQTIAAAQGG